MDAREKLRELVNRAITDWEHGDASEMIAHHLLSNGVTVQSGKDINVPSKWIPVTERLPDKDGDYLVFKRFAGSAWSDVVSFAKDGRKVSECSFGEKWQNVWYYYDSEWGYMRTDAVTHWMPLPQPPKDGTQENACLERR